MMTPVVDPIDVALGPPHALALDVVAKVVSGCAPTIAPRIRAAASLKLESAALDSGGPKKRSSTGYALNTVPLMALEIPGALADSV
jgi:hypothetical protein